MTAKHLRIYGEVQGVFYRVWAVETATALGVAGWVRNRRDGSVEALVSGDKDAVETFLARCRDGPPEARVERIDVEDTDDGVGSRFEKRPTL